MTNCIFLSPRFSFCHPDVGGAYIKLIGFRCFLRQHDKKLSQHDKKIRQGDKKA